MSHLLVYFLYCLIGAIEWFLAAQRVRAWNKGVRWLVFLIVVLEVLLGFFIFDKFMTGENKDWTVAFVYALGCGAGAASTMTCDKSKNTKKRCKRSVQSARKN